MLAPAAAPNSNQGMPANTIDSPLGIQVGSPWLWSPTVTSRGVPPSAGITKIFQGFPGREAINAIWVPSGDQRGICACIGEYVSWVRELPSGLLRHSVSSGCATYVIHSPLRVISASPADTPEREIENCGDLVSRRIKSNRRCWPITNSFFPSGLGVGLLNMSGPTVSCVGSVLALRIREARSRKAQMFWVWSRVDSNRK